VELVNLSPEMVDDALSLSTGAGWNQTAEDWLALMTDSPDGCLGIACDGKIVATTTLVCYEKRLAWIGMVLTHSEYQRRGLARTLVMRAVELAREREVCTIKLDATDQGRPLYQSLGFREEQAVERWGCDVAAMGEYRWRTPPVMEDGGYLLHRPGLHAHYLGPCVANDPVTAERLFRQTIEHLSADRYFWDLLPANADAVALARKLGFASLRKLTRMVMGPNPVEDLSRVYAIAGFEWG
jgi:GNAT superfamily N-acetyltransferase